MPVTTAYEQLPIDSQCRLDEICVHFEEAWARPERPNLTAHLADAPPGERTAWLTELLHVELECRRRAGESPRPAEYHDLLPNDTAVVNTVFAEAAAGAVGMGSLVGKYRLQRLIGWGGMSSVFEADDPVIGRPVAVKLLTGRADAARVTEEARLAGRLVHPNIVTIYEAGCDGDVWYMAMERLAVSAAERVNHVGPFDPLTATRIAAEVCRGLVAAHRAGLIHRDIKPANVLLNEDPGALVAKLSDFGLAHEASEVDPFVTAGTPAYMPPEESIGPLGDVYSLGATYYTLLTGRPPYEATTAAEARAAHRHAPIPNPRAVRPEVPAKVARIVARAMAKNPARRFPDAGAMLADLEAVLADPRPSRLRRALIATVVLILAALIVLAVVPRPVPEVQQPSPHEEPETSWTDLFNGRDLTGWETFVMGGKPGKDPHGVFSIVEKDGEPMIRVSGTRQGALTTRDEYENYHLRLEYRWETPEGEHNSGVAYHANGPHGQGIHGLMRAHQLDLNPPTTGTYQCSDEHRLCDLAKLSDGRLEPVAKARDWVHPLRDYEHGFGSWNQIELVCVGDSALHIVNGCVVLALVRSRTPTPSGEAPLTRGRLQLQSHQGTIYFRRVQIRSMTEIPTRFHRMVANPEG